MIALLSLAWGLLVALPLVEAARRVVPVVRVRKLVSVREPARGRAPTSTSRPRLRPRDALRRAAPPLATLAAPWVERAARRRHEARVRRELPVAVELLRVALASGLTPVQAVELVARFGPPAVAPALARVGSRVSLGIAFSEALRELRLAEPALERLADVLSASGELGVAVGDALSRLGGEVRAEVRRAAEARARRVPVRLLFPLVFLVLPAFGLLGVVPSVLAGFGG